MTQSEDRALGVSRVEEATVTKWFRSEIVVRGLLLFFAVATLCGCASLQGRVLVRHSPLEEGWDIPAAGAAWEVGNRGHNSEMAVVEYVPRGKQITDWSSLITTQTFVSTPEPGLLSAMLRVMYEQLSVDCASLKFSVLEDSRNSIVYEWSHLGCQGFSAQHEISRLQLGQVAVHRLAFTTKTTRIDDHLRSEWIDVIRRAVIVSPAPYFSLQQGN